MNRYQMCRHCYMWYVVLVFVPGGRTQMEYGGEWNPCVILALYVINWLNNTDLRPNLPCRDTASFGIIQNFPVEWNRLNFHTFVKVTAADAIMSHRICPISGILRPRPQRGCFFHNSGDCLFPYLFITSYFGFHLCTKYIYIYIHLFI